MFKSSLTLLTTIAVLGMGASASAEVLQLANPGASIGLLNNAGDLDTYTGDLVPDTLGGTIDFNIAGTIGRFSGDDTSNNHLDVPYWDLVGNFAGMGVHTAVGAGGANDNVFPLEVLTFTLDDVRTITSLQFYNSEHVATWAAGNTLSIDVDGNITMVDMSTLVNGVYELNQAGSVFKFSSVAGHGQNDINAAFYVGAMTVVPEPSTYALLGTSLLVAGAARRRKLA